MGTKDLRKKGYLYAPERFADLVNGVLCGGRQVLAASDLTDMDTQTGQFVIGGYGGAESTGGDNDRNASGDSRNGSVNAGNVNGNNSTGSIDAGNGDGSNGSIDAGNEGSRDRRERQGKRGEPKDRRRDLVRRAAFGVNFMVVGIENQEETDYLMPLRCMSYDAAEYERQASQAGREVRNRDKDNKDNKYNKNNKNDKDDKNKNSDRSTVTKAEFLSGFRKESRLAPCVTIVLYYGDEWDGATTLKEILNMEGIPPELQNEVNDYKIHLCEVRKFENTEVFRTDVKQVFDCLRYAEEPDRLRELVANDPSYRAMEPDTYDAIAEYTKTTELMRVKTYHEKEGKVDMCRAITELVERGRREGMEQGMEQGMERGIQQGLAQGIRGIVETIREFGSTKEEAARRLREKMKLSDEEAERYVGQYWA